MTSQPNRTLSDEAMANLVAFGATLQQIHKHLISEGYFLNDGRTWNIFKAGLPLVEMKLEELGSDNQ